MLMTRQGQVLAVVRFSYEVPDHGTVWWNVSQALREIQAGHFFKTAEIDRAQMAGVRDQNCWNAQKIDHVDPAIPGIGAPMFIPELREVGYILIDGTHRCVRALRDGLPFQAHLLTDAAAKRCIISGPPELLWPK